jgi:hypothetical protein
MLFFADPVNKIANFLHFSHGLLLFLMGTERVALECERGMFSFDTTPNWSDPIF